MTLNSLNSLIDDVIQEARNSHVTGSEELSRNQVEMWIHNYRALLIKQDLDKGRKINPEYLQWVDPPMHVSEVSNYPGKTEWITDDELPSVLDLHYGTGLVAIKDVFGNLIQVGDETKAKLQKYRKVTCNDYIAFLKNKHIQLEGPGYLEYIQPGIILENPTDISKITGMCFDYNAKYPVPANMIRTIVDLIFDHELNRMFQVQSDETNNGSNDLLNSPNRITTGRGRGQNRLTT